MWVVIRLVGVFHHHHPPLFTLFKKAKHEQVGDICSLSLTFVKCARTSVHLMSGVFLAVFLHSLNHHQGILKCKVRLSCKVKAVSCQRYFLFFYVFKGLGERRGLLPRIRRKAPNKTLLFLSCVVLMYVVNVISYAILRITSLLFFRPEDIDIRHIDIYVTSSRLSVMWYSNVVHSR